jgi:hypothetical protein
MKQKNITTIIVLLFILTIIWIGGSFWYSAKTSTISDDINKDIAPIDPNFDIKTIDELRSREKIIPMYDLETTTSAPITTISASPTPVASQGGKLSL